MAGAETRQLHQYSDSVNNEMYWKAIVFSCGLSKNNRRYDPDDMLVSYKSCGFGMP